MNLTHLKGGTCLLTLVLALSATSCDNQDKPEEPKDARRAKLELLEGFTAGHIYSPSDNGNGSWVSMTFDNQGRMNESDQNGAHCRIVLPPIGAESTSADEKQTELQ